MREVIVTELIKEVLGPRNGIRETIPDSPLDEYITGVLAPVTELPPQPDIDDEAELPVAEFSGESEEDEPESDVTPPLLAPALNPQSRPHSIGLSFIVETAVGHPAVNVCLTWARYSQVASTWQRQPRHTILTIGNTPQRLFFFDASGNEVGQHDQPEVYLSVRFVPRSNGCFLVSLYLVNCISVPQGQYPGPDHHVFQPQIRVDTPEGVSVVPGLEGLPKTREERELQFLYRDRPVLARGHLCSAVWERIDPESARRVPPLDFPEALQSPPFNWIDGELLEATERQIFSPPQVRTEFVPVYSIESPVLQWPAGYGNAPETRTEQLAELWDATSIGDALQPLADGYRSWIEELRETGHGLPEREREIASRLVEECESVTRRIQKGIDLLVQNDDARLAFCFAMKAIAIQSTWGSARAGAAPRPLTWYPFQLGFILMALESIANPASTERQVCDLLWVATGAGKTEAYLALAAFTMAHRRLRALRRRTGDRTGAGVSVISRYTLRLLTIQQFRRTIKMVTACEYLRVYDFGTGSPVGWRPRGYPVQDNFIWGSSSFGAGLWVGGGVTPNRLSDTWGGNRNIPGAISILTGRGSGEGEPAQILRCPACDSVLSVPQREDKGLSEGTYTLHLTIQGTVPRAVTPGTLSFQSLTVTHASITPLSTRGYATLSVEFTSTERVIAEDIDDWWNHIRGVIRGINIVCARASRPGYFIRSYTGRNRQMEYDFEIYCPGPQCSLRRPWFSGMPSGGIHGTTPHPNSPAGGVSGLPAVPDGNRYTHAQEAFRTTLPYLSDRIPVPALTVDEQIYHRCPTIVIATVDKFARPPFEPRAAALFGSVNFHHCIWGYYREGTPPPSSPASNGHAGPTGTAASRNYVSVSPLDPPDLILQDELHLIEGPLGSLVGLYETAVDFLCGEVVNHPVKYICSTATVREAESQVRAVFCRGLATYPPLGLSADDRFLLRFPEGNPLDDRSPGRLYVGICAPGRGPLTPIVRIWSRLLRTAWQHRAHGDIDRYWTLTGYFNAVRELAGARALYRQDIPDRLRRISGTDYRPLNEDRSQELSGRTPSTELPTILDLLSVSYPQAQDSLFTTSMFGTGVDIRRLGLMVVSGQPKTTSSYIQATGRVGRTGGALVVTFLRASRPRDLNHYEFFSGYHCQLHRFVEPVTVMPFAPGAVERSCGPVGAFILRNRRNTGTPWHVDASAPNMAVVRATNREVQEVPRELESRAQSQPAERAPVAGSVEVRSNAALDRWQQIARARNNISYVEYAIDNPPSRHVVLGDPQHLHANLDVVYPNVPQSLRDIEETCGFQT